MSGVGLQVIGFRNHFGGQPNGYPLATRACKSRALVFVCVKVFLMVTRWKFIGSYRSANSCHEVLKNVLCFGLSHFQQEHNFVCHSVDGNKQSRLRIVVTSCKIKRCKILYIIINTYIYIYIYIYIRLYYSFRSLASIGKAVGKGSHDALVQPYKPLAPNIIP